MYLEMELNISHHNNEVGVERELQNHELYTTVYVNIQYLLYWNWLALCLSPGLRRGGFFLGDWDFSEEGGGDKPRMHCMFSISCAACSLLS